MTVFDQLFGSSELSLQARRIVRLGASSEECGHFSYWQEGRSQPNPPRSTVRCDGERLGTTSVWGVELSSIGGNATDKHVTQSGSTDQHNALRCQKISREKERGTRNGIVKAPRQPGLETRESSWASVQAKSLLFSVVIFRPLVLLVSLFVFV